MSIWIQDEINLVKKAFSILKDPPDIQKDQEEGGYLDISPKDGEEGLAILKEQKDGKIRFALFESGEQNFEPSYSSTDLGTVIYATMEHFVDLVLEGILK